MTIYELKPRFQNMLRPIVVFLANNKYTPNQITWLALMLSTVFGIALFYTNASDALLLLLPFFLFFRMALNAIDGMLAREHNMQSKSGAVLNELSDVVADIVIYLPFALISNINATAVVLFVMVGLLTEMAGVTSQVVYGQRRYEGPMGKSDRAFLMGLVALLLGFNLLSVAWINGVFILGTILGILTIYNRSKI